MGFGVVADRQAGGQDLSGDVGVLARRASDLKERGGRVLAPQDAQNLGREGAGAVVERKRHVPAPARPLSDEGGVAQYAADGGGLRRRPVPQPLDRAARSVPDEARSGAPRTVPEPV